MPSVNFKPVDDKKYCRNGALIGIMVGSSTCVGKLGYDMCKDSLSLSKKSIKEISNKKIALLVSIATLGGGLIGALLGKISALQQKDFCNKIQAMLENKQQNSWCIKPLLNK